MVKFFIRHHVLFQTCMCMWMALLTCACSKEEDEKEKTMWGIWTVERIVPAVEAPFQINDRLQFDAKTLLIDRATPLQYLWDLSYYRAGSSYELNVWERNHGFDRRGLVVYPITFSGEEEAVLKVKASDRQAACRIYIRKLKGIGGRN